MAPMAFVIGTRSAGSPPSGHGLAVGGGGEGGVINFMAGDGLSCGGTGDGVGLFGGVFSCIGQLGFWFKWLAAQNTWRSAPKTAS